MTFYNEVIQNFSGLCERVPDGPCINSDMDIGICLPIGVVTEADDCYSF